MATPDWLKIAAQRSEGETWMLGHVFSRYRELEGLTHETLLAELGCSPEVLQWLSLCRRPEGERFAEHVLTIAKRFGVDPRRLATVIRHVEVMDALAPQQDGGGAARRGSLLLAARDRPKDEEPGS
jgi:hypothetical protein